MTTYLLLFAASIGGGLFGSLLGLGGGIILVPVYTLLFKMPVIQAVSLSLCTIMATSVTASTKFLTSGLVDLKVALDMEITTIIGSFVGALAAGWIGPQALTLVFSAVILYAAFATLIPRQEGDGSDYEPSRKRYGFAVGISVFSVAIVGLLGIGGGVVKVPILHLLLHKSIKEAVATSALMVGITTCTAVIPYFSRGEVRIEYVPYAALGTICGAYVGSRVLHRISSLYLKLLFSGVLIYTALRMILKALG